MGWSNWSKVTCPRSQTRQSVMEIEPMTFGSQVRQLDHAPHLTHTCLWQHTYPKFRSRSTNSPVPFVFLYRDNELDNNYLDKYIRFVRVIVFHQVNFNITFKILAYHFLVSTFNKLQLILSINLEYSSLPVAVWNFCYLSRAHCSGIDIV